MKRTWRIPVAASGAWREAALIAALFGAVWLAYYPSLGHGPRADQWCYLLDTVDRHHFSTLFAHTYSYNRTRAVCPGDYHLFRPVLFALLSAEKALFGNNFALWQAAGVVLHCLVLYLLLRLMLRIHDLTSAEMATPSTKRWFSGWTILRALPYALVLFFGVNCTVVELVIWSHINGYVLFIVFVLGSMLLLFKVIAGGESSPPGGRWLLAAAWLLTLLSAFTYEIGQFYAVIAGALAAVALYRKGGARRSAVVFAVFLSILILYRLADSLDQRAHAERAPDIDTATILQRTTSAATLAHAGRYILYCAVQPFFPSWVEWSFNSRLVITETAALHWRDGSWNSAPLVSYLVVGGMAALTLIALLRLPSARHKRAGLIAALLAFSLFALHMTITVVGRMNLRPGPEVLCNNSYYTYLPLLALMLAAYAMWGFLNGAQSARAMWLSNSLATLVFGGLVVLSLSSAAKVYDINVKGKDDFAGFTRRIASVERFIRHHGREADFSLGFDIDSCNAVGTQYSVPITTILFKRYGNSSPPKYMVGFPQGEPSLWPYAEWRQARSGCGTLCPELVGVGSSYHYYRAEGWYYGVLHWDGYYDPSRRDYAYPIKARTLEGARRQQSAKLLEQDADIRAGRFIPPEIGVTLLQEGYKGFNLIGCTGKVYAIPQGEGAFDRRKTLDHGYSRSYVANTCEDVKRQIDKRESKTRQQVPCSIP